MTFLLGLGGCGQVSNSSDKSINSQSDSISKTSSNTDDTNSKSSMPSILEISNIEVIKYQEFIYVGETFDENSVEIKITFEDESSKIYSGEDLLFYYNEFNNEKVGVYDIKIKIIEHNKTVNIKVEVKEDENSQSIRLLMISNSFGDDTVQWVHEISEDLEVDFTIANLYIGGCTLEKHLNNLINNNSSYEYVVYNKDNKTWERHANTSISSALFLEDWNYVALQQGSTESGVSSTYSMISQIMDKVLEIKDNVKFVWNMTWAYQQDSGHVNFGNYNNDQSFMYDSIIKAVQDNIVTNNRFEIIVPNGTAIQNARTSYIGDTLCRDEYCHLTYDLGRYIAGLTMVGALTNKNISEVEFSPGLSDYQKLVAIESVQNALDEPFKITQSEYTDPESDTYTYNLFEGKTFEPTLEALNAVFPPWNSSVYFGYETLTDGKMSELEGRFSTTFDGLACATLDLGGSYIIDELRFYDYKQDAEYMGSSLIVEIYSNGEWINAANYSTNSEIASHRVDFGSGAGAGWIEVDLGGAEASQVKFTIPSTYNAKTISIYEIMCFGSLKQ